jgi:hypothetical protein
MDIEKSRADIEKSRADIEKIRADIEKTRIDIEKSRVDTEKGRADTEKTRIDIEKGQIEIRSQQPQLAIQLEVSEVDSSDPDYHTILSITVILKNEGDQPLWIGFDEHTLTIGRVKFGKSGKQRVYSVVHFAPMYFSDRSTVLKRFNERILRVGQARRMTLALVPVTDLRSYLIQFSAVYARVELTTPNREEATRLGDIPIEAIEQRFYIATGKAEALAPSSPAVQNS